MVSAPGRPSSPRRRPFRPRRWAWLLLLFAGVAVGFHLFLPAGPFPSNERRVILVQRGEGLKQIARELERNGLIHGTLGFEALARLMHLDRSIKAGQYSFKLGTTVPALLRAFARGMSGLNLVTIPEGLRTVDVSLLLSNHLGVPMAAFDSLSRNRAFLDSLGIDAPTIEGYLAPDSYEFLPGTAPEVAFRTMALRTVSLLRKAAGTDTLPLGLSLHEVLTLASIVECEAQVSDERPKIAQVYLNRIRINMRLQADPTVLYGMGRQPRSRAYLRDLTRDTPYNTYLHLGLPPGPISNPSRKSIEAVFHPAAEVQDLYFVARGQGRHFFARTYEEHLENIRQARAIIAASRDTAKTALPADTTAISGPRPAPAAAPVNP